MNPRAGRSRLVWPAALAALVIVAGTIGRWGSDGVITVDGLDTSDGKVILGVAIVSLLLIVAGYLAGSQWAFLLPTLGGAFCAVISILDLSDFSDAGADVGWGLYATIAGSIALTGLALALLATPRRGRGGSSVVGDAPLER
jgi:hypothetical protein